MDEKIETAGLNDYVLCEKCQTSVAYAIIADCDGMCQACYIEQLVGSRSVLLDACKDGLKFIISLPEPDSCWQADDIDAFRRTLTKAITAAE